MELTKRKIGTKWIVTHRSPTQAGQLRSASFNNEAEADNYVQELVSASAWKSTNDHAKSIVNQVTGGQL
jgi:hypothetical protein